MKIEIDFYLIKRSIKHWWQRRIRGWDDSETWGLYYYIAKFGVPRLKRFKEICGGVPCNLNESKWDEILDDIIYSLEHCVKDQEDLDYIGSTKDWERIDRGLNYFGEYFRDLWW